MGGSPIVLGSTRMVSSPLHLTANLKGRLVTKASLLNSTPEFGGGAVAGVDPEHQHGKVNDNPLHGDVFLEMELSDDSHGSTSDLAIRKLLQRSTLETDAPQGKHVGFGVVSTRSYNIVLGDHPCCSMGCPLALGWIYTQCPSVSIDEFEATRPPRRHREELRTSWDQRRTILADVSDREVKHMERKLHRERSCQRQRNRRACAAFFGGPLPEDCKATAAVDVAAAAVAPTQQQQQQH